MHGPAFEKLNADGPLAARKRYSLQFASRKKEGLIAALLPRMSKLSYPSPSIAPLHSLQICDRGRLVSFDLRQNDGGVYLEISTVERGRRNRIFVSSEALPQYVAAL